MANLPASLTPSNPEGNWTEQLNSLPDQFAPVVVRLLWNYNNTAIPEPRADGQFWPPVGGTITVTAGEAYGLVLGRTAEYVEDGE